MVDDKRKNLTSSRLKELLIGMTIAERVRFMVKYAKLHAERTKNNRVKKRDKGREKRLKKREKRNND